MEEREALMNLRPQTTTEKLLWERRGNKILSGELKEARLELGMLRSDFDEYKDLSRRSNDVEDKYACLVLAHTKTKKHQKALDGKIRDGKRERDQLIVKIASINLKLKEYENE